VATETLLVTAVGALLGTAATLTTRATMDAALARPPGPGGPNRPPTPPSVAPPGRKTAGSRTGAREGDPP
ncbi:hypothetical protein ACWEO5_38290, partial [Kitasatospora sp. NPDC004272]